jgi:nicotinamidase-related amidase
MVRAFVEDRYAFGFSKTGIPCTKAIRKLLDVARPLKIPIFFTKVDKYNESFRNLDPEANEVTEDLAPQTGEMVLEKIGPSAFFSTPLASLLNRMKVDTLIVTGMVTSGCVRGTAVDAFAYEYRVIVPVECVADRSQISHEVSLFDLSMKYAHVMALSELIHDLSVLSA